MLSRKSELKKRERGQEYLLRRKKNREKQREGEKKNKDASKANKDCEGKIQHEIILPTSFVTDCLQKSYNIL